MAGARRVRCAYPPYGDEADVGFVWRVRFAYTPYEDDADVGFVWRVRCAYTPYGDEADVGFAWRVRWRLPALRKCVMCDVVGWVSAAH
ncbi:hypothetical protein QLY72_20405, partial [Cronobacter malonaticus]|uniref:hypothetical protein n=2 Tax=Cronobacter malonaticus TaxID=413503 RepID=UPI0024AF1DE6